MQGKFSIRTAAGVAAGVFLLAACARPRVAFNPKADFSKVRRVGVATFAGPNGGAAADIMAQDLVEAGLDVIERNRLNAVLDEHSLVQTGVLDPDTAVKLHKILGVDALVIGSVTSYSGGQSYLVQTDDADIKIGGSVTPLASRNVYSRGQVLGVPNTHIISTAASVGLVARLVDVQTGSILWSARMTYEGFDGESAMAAITQSFVKSLTTLRSSPGK